MPPTLTSNRVRALSSSLANVYASKNNLEAGAFATGLEKIGWQVKRYNASDHGKGQTIPCDLLVISGTRGKGRTLLDDYAAIGVPAVVIDYGYLDRVSGVRTWETGHWQAGIGGLNRLPAFPCPTDRLENLRVAPAAPRTGDLTLVLGQHSGDPSHGLTDAEMTAWAQRVCDETGGYWRPHPDSPHIRVNAPVAEGPLSGWLARAKCVRTLCSTGGLEALIAGVPAVAEMPERACWGELSGYEHPGAKRVTELCARLAYGQWTLNEMRSGEAARFITENLERWNG